ncbi:MAG: DUF1893 domain-containing protein [Clostridiales bacterium]|nr:DUF1893 domain-containing protein [Clostridiales bacterium]
MTDLQTAKTNLAGHSICLCKDGKCLYGEKRGIAPIMDFIADGVDLNGYSVADKVVGKAAAMLLIKCGVKSVYAEVLSGHGKRILERYGVAVDHATLTESIINRAGTDMCPMEKAVLDTDNLDEAFAILKEKTQKA